MSDLVQMAQQILQSQPFSAWLGAQCTACGPQDIELRLPITASLLQQHGFVHGGVVSYMADNALTFAGGLALGPAVVTAEYKINYLRPARGTTLIARSSVVQAGRRQAVCRCDVFCLAESDEVLCAVAQGTIAVLGDGPRAAG